jgi:hypothetical protein
MPHLLDFFRPPAMDGVRMLTSEMETGRRGDRDRPLNIGIAVLQC